MYLGQSKGSQKRKKNETRGIYKFGGNNENMQYASFVWGRMDYRSNLFPDKSLVMKCWRLYFLSLGARDLLCLSLSLSLSRHLNHPPIVYIQCTFIMYLSWQR